MPANLIPTTIEDIDLLISSQASEGEELEFKQALSTSDGSPDAWMTTADRIGKTAKRELAKEVIAFANSRGGTLILGIGEDGEKRAATKHPLPKCRALADRLAQSIASSVDPQLGSLESWGIETHKDGSGFVVLRVPASFRAPHRDRDERECYRRVGDRSEPMDMRSIHDLVLQRSRGIETVQSALNQRSAAMVRRLAPTMVKLNNGSNQLAQACTVRATAIPLEPINIPRLAFNRSFHFPQPDLRSGSIGLLHSRQLRWNPILRGITDAAEYNFFTRTILASGLVETQCEQYEYAATNITPTPVGFPFEYIIGVVASTILLAAALRVRLQRPDLEFALDIEWRFPEGANLLLSSRAYHIRTLPPLSPISRVSDYVIPSNDSLPSLFTRVEEDIWGSFGQSYNSHLEIDANAAIEEMVPSQK